MAMKTKIMKALGYNEIITPATPATLAVPATLTTPAIPATPATPSTITYTPRQHTLADWYENSHKLQTWATNYNDWFNAHPKTSKAARVIGAGMGAVPTFVYVASQVPGPAGVVAALGAGTGMGIIGAARPAAGILAGAVESWATIHPVTKTKEKVIDHAVPTGTVVADLEAHLGETYHVDSVDHAKELTHYLNLNNLNWSNVANSDVNYIFEKDGTGNVNITLNMKDGGVMTYNAKNVKTLSPEKARDAFAIANGHANFHNGVGDVEVFTTPTFDSHTLSVYRPIAKEDQANVQKETGISGAKAIEAKWTAGTKTVSYSVYGADGKAVAVAKDKVLAAFNWVEDGDMSVDHFSNSKVVGALENIVNVWDAAQGAQREDWNTTYALGMIAAQHGLNVSSDFGNLTTKDGLMGYIASWATDHNAKVNTTYLQNLTSTQLLTELAAMADTDGKSVEFKALKDYALAKMPNLDKENKTKIQGMTESDANRSAILNILYDKTISTGSEAGYQQAVKDAISVAIKDGADWAANDSLEKILGNIYGKGVDVGYEQGLQELRLYQFMNSINSSLLQNLTGENANATLAQWEVNAGIHPELYDFFQIDNAKNATVWSNFYNDGNITNATKEFVRGYVDSGNAMKVYNLVNAKEDPTGKTGAFIAAYKDGKYIEGHIISDKEYGASATLRK